MPTFEEQVTQMRAWFESPRFAGIKRLYTAREVVEQRGTIRDDYTVARDAASAFHTRLNELFRSQKCMTSFGPYSPGEAVAMKRMGIEGIYVGGWATSAKGSATKIPDPTSRATRSVASPTKPSRSCARCSLPTATSSTRAAA